jgi:hypothetical protein
MAGDIELFDVTGHRSYFYNSTTSADIASPIYSLLD